MRHLGSLPHLCTKNETIAPLHVATLTVQRELRLEPWFHSWYRGRVETLDAKLFVALFELLVWPHEVEPWFHSWYRGRVETLDAHINFR